MNRNETLRYILDGLNAAGADMGECNLSDTVKTEVYYESGKISMVRTNYDTSIAVKAVKDGKKGQIVLNSTDKESLDGAINGAMEALSSAIPDDAEGICDIAAKESFKKGVRGKPDLDDMYDRMTEFLTYCKEKYPKVSFDSITVEHNLIDKLYMNTNGTELSEEMGYYLFSPMFMARDGEKTSSFNASGVIFDDISKPLISLSSTENLISEAEKQIDTVAFDGKTEGDIIFSPDCFGSLLSDIERTISDGYIIDGTSIYRNKLGEKIAADSVTVISSPRSPETVAGSAFTGDGYIAENMPIIENGILKNFVLSRYSAAKTGLKRSASAGGDLVMSAGQTSLADMIKTVKKGLYVNRLSGGEPAGNGDFSAVAKNSFLIEDGKLTDAISETMLTGNLAKMLLDIKEISSERLSDGSSVMPWVKVDGLVISGK